MAHTGNGTSANWATSGFTAEIISIEHGEETLEMLDTSHLQTTGSMTKMPADLSDPGDLTITGYYTDGSVPELGVVELLTITESDDSITTGTGCFSSRSLGTIANNQTRQFTATWSWTDAPTHSAGT